MRVSSDSCHLRELWLRWAALELRQLLSCGSHGICSLLVQATDSQQRQANPAVVVMIKKNSTKLIFQLHDFMQIVVVALLDEYSAGCVCVCVQFPKVFSS